jgi:hypothetical protein
MTMEGNGIGERRRLSANGYWWVYRCSTTPPSSSARSDDIPGWNSLKDARGNVAELALMSEIGALLLIHVCQLHGKVLVRNCPVNFFASACRHLTTVHMYLYSASRRSC